MFSTSSGIYLIYLVALSLSLRYIRHYHIWHMCWQCSTVGVVVGVVVVVLVVVVVVAAAVVVVVVVVVIVVVVVAFMVVVLV